MDTVVMFLIVFCIVVYFLPAIIAISREHQHRVPILLLNLFLGWTAIGWVAALVWSAMPVTTPPRQSAQSSVPVSPEFEPVGGAAPPTWKPINNLTPLY